jgi:hypothetical protein
MMGHQRPDHPRAAIPTGVQNQVVVAGALDPGKVKTAAPGEQIIV